MLVIIGTQCFIMDTAAVLKKSVIPVKQRLSLNPEKLGSLLGVLILRLLSLLDEARHNRQFNILV